MPPQRAVPKSSEPHAAPAKKSDATTVEQQGRPTRKSKPTTKAVELANNSSSKLFKSLKKDDQMETLEVEEVDDEVQHPTSKEGSDQVAAAISGKASSSIPTDQEPETASTTPDASTSEPQSGPGLHLRITRTSEVRGRKVATPIEQAVSSEPAALEASAQPRKRKRARENVEVIEEPVKKQETPAPASRTSRSKRKHDEQDEEVVVTPAKRPRRTVKADHETGPSSDPDFAPTASEGAGGLKSASSKPQRRRRTNASTAAEGSPLSGFESNAPLPTVPKIMLKFPGSASMADLEEAKDLDIERAGTNPSRTNGSKRPIQVPDKEDKKRKAKEASTAKTRKRKRKSPSPAEAMEEPSEDELAPEPVKPQRAKKAKHAPLEVAGGAIRHSTSPKISPGKKLTSEGGAAAEGQQQQRSHRTCDGSCLTFEEKLFAMAEIVAADHKTDTQEDLDALMAPYCKCRPQGRDEEQAPVRTLKLRLHGLKEGSRNKS